MLAATFVRRARTTALRPPAKLRVGVFAPATQSSHFRFLSTPRSNPTESESDVKADRGESDLGGAEEVVTVISETTIVEKTVLSADHHENRPHHPGRSDIEHLDNPSTSEEMVHADRHPAHTEDLLKQGQGKRGYSTSSSGHQTDGKSGLPHLDQPTLSEEIVHADRSEIDPLGASKQKKKDEMVYGETTGPIVVKMGTQAVEPEDAVLRGEQQ